MGGVRARESEDIFLDKVGVKWGVKTREMDVNLDQFSYAWLGVKCDLKYKPNFSKNSHLNFLNQEFQRPCL